MQNPTIVGIESKIYLIRGHKVLLDSDLALLYGVDTKVLNQAVRRNAERFPDDFMFQLIEIEWNFLKSQIVTSNAGRGGKQKLPLVFTEYGVAMLSSVLKSDRAIQVNISIMRAFGKLREILESNKEFAKRLSDLDSRYDEQFAEVFQAIRELMSERSVPTKRIIGLAKKDD
jgi:hypothetical protein